MTALAWIVGGGTLWAVSSTAVALALGAMIGRARVADEPLPVPTRRRTPSTQPPSTQPRSLQHLPCAAGRTLSRG